MVHKGNTSGSILSEAFESPAKIKSYTLVNKTAGTITVKVAIIEAGNQVHIDFQSLAANASYQCDVEIQMLAGFELLIIASGSLDYYFTID